MASLRDQRRSPFDPRFPLDFRWRRAIELVDLGRRARRPYDDEFTFRARRHVAALRRCRTEQDRVRLAAADPDLDAARRLHTGHPLPRALLEAAILSGQDDADAAAACGLTHGTASLYHAVFFDVRDWLDARFFILHCLLPIQRARPFAATDEPAMLKRLAYEFGPTIVEPCLRYFAGLWSIPADVRAVTAAELRELERILWVHAAIQERTLPARKSRRVEALTKLLDEFGALVDAREADAARASERSSEVFEAEVDAAKPTQTAAELLQALVAKRPLAA